jgi:hypothetical protein
MKKSNIWVVLDLIVYFWFGAKLIWFQDSVSPLHMTMGGILLLVLGCAQSITWWLDKKKEELNIEISIIKANSTEVQKMLITATITALETSVTRGDKSWAEVEDNIMHLRKKLKELDST